MCWIYDMINMEPIIYYISDILQYPNKKPFSHTHTHFKMMEYKRADL